MVLLCALVRNTSKITPVTHPVGGPSRYRLPTPRHGTSPPVSHALCQRLVGETVDFDADHAIGIGEVDCIPTGDRLDATFEPFKRLKLVRRPNRDGSWRIYQDYELPDSGGSIVTVPMTPTSEDEKTKFHRCENVRCIPKGDPDYGTLLGRRQDIESINRSLEDTLFLGRAHSLGHRRQRVDLLGFAILTNSIAVSRHRQRLPSAA